jgi:hypothetical protein
MVKDFRKVVSDERDSKKLAQLERELAEANSDVAYALDKLHAVAAGAAA